MKFNSLKGIPWRSSGWDSVLSLPWPQEQRLVRERRSHKPSSTAAKKKKSHSFKIWKVTVPTIVLLVSHLDDWASPLSPLHFLHTRVNLTVPSGHHAALKPPGGPQFLPKLAHPLQTIGFVLFSGLFPLFLPILLSGQIPHSLEIALSFPMTMSITELPSATNVHYVLCF